MRKGANRRDFLKASAAAGVGYWVAGRAVAQESKSPNEQINFACIGVDGKGASDSADAGRHGNVVALCDIDRQRLDKAGLRWPNAKKYTDYRKMLDEMGMSIDAVTVSTPDHHHAPAALRAMRMGIHCFCQKPLTHTLEEARLMGEVARQKKLATQMGNQGTADAPLREAAAIMKSGALGTIKEVHVWTNRPVWPQGIELPTEEVPVPDYVAWDEWLGPAPERPYNPIYHPFKWRGWWAFGTGALGDMACHTLNVAFMGLNLRNPVSVKAQTSGHNKQTYPSWSVIDYEFPAIDGRAAVNMRWYDGKKLPPAELLKGEKMEDSGLLAVGEKGTLYAPGDYCGSFKLIGMEKPKVEFPRSPGHFEEWVRAIRGGEPAMSNFPDYAAPLTETVLLGNLAVWVDGTKVEWDAENLVAKNAPEAEPLIRKEYRKGYDIHEQA